MKRRYIPVVSAILSVCIVLVGIHYSYSNSMQRVTELPLCNGQYVPAGPDGTLGNFCQGTGPSKVVSVNVRQRDDVQYYVYAVAGIVLAGGILVSFANRSHQSSTH